MYIYIYIYKYLYVYIYIYIYIYYQSTIILLYAEDTKIFGKYEQTEHTND